MYYIGIDPGVNGGICVLRDGVPSEIIRFPTFEVEVNKKKRKKIDAHKLAEILVSLSSKYIGSLVVLEEVSPMPMDGAKSAFAFGEAYGTIKGIMSAKEIPWTQVRPQKWKAALGIKGGKDESIMHAKRIYPNEIWDKKCNHDLADAMLIAYWAHLFRN